MRLVEVPHPDNKPDEDYFSLAINIDLSGGLSVNIILPDAIVDEIIMRGDRYFISMEADGTALILSERGGEPLSYMTETETFEGLVDSYVDAAGHSDDLFKTHAHLLRAKDTLERCLQKVTASLAKLFADYPDNYKADHEEYRIKE